MAEKKPKKAAPKVAPKKPEPKSPAKPPASSPINPPKGWGDFKDFANWAYSKATSHPIRKIEETLRTGKGPSSFKRGGRVRKTAVYKLHRGEQVIPARKARRVRKRGMSKY